MLYVQYFLGFGISPFLAVPISSARLIMGPLHFRPNFALISIKKPCRGLWRKILNENKFEKNEILSPLAIYFDKLSENIYNNDLTILHDDTREIVLQNCAPLYGCVNRENFH